MYPHTNMNMFTLSRLINRRITNKIVHEAYGQSTKRRKRTEHPSGEMVMKISAWGQKLSSKVLAQGHHTPDMFVKSQWQRSAGVSVYYLMYRWVMACIFLFILVASLLDVGRPEVDVTKGTHTVVVYYAKWPIYLTHWGITLCTVQAIAAAYLVTRAHCLQPEVGVDTMKMECSLRVYWVLHHCATVGAFAITAIYWLFVYNPEENQLDALNLAVHAGNSILMLTDLVVVSFPIRLIDFLWPIAFSVLYILFNYIYYALGGTDRKGRTYIYKILDWTRPGKTLIIVQLCVVFALFLHISVCMFSFVRHKLSESWRRKQAIISEERSRNLQGISNEIPINDLA